MTEIISFLQGEAFGPDALRAMSTALEEVCRMLRVDHDKGAREVIAVRIVELARGGEHDPERLRNRVLREASATPWVIGAAPTPDAGVTRMVSTASMSDQAKDNQPKDANRGRP
jgi:hypothetical protein